MKAFLQGMASVLDLFGVLGEPMLHERAPKGVDPDWWAVGQDWNAVSGELTRAAEAARAAHAGSV